MHKVRYLKNKYGEIVLQELVTYITFEDDGSKIWRTEFKNVEVISEEPEID